MKICVTGGAGFIGANLVRELLHRDHEVLVIDDFSTGFRENLVGVDCEIVESSILDFDALSNSLAGMDSIVHLAALGSVPRSVLDPRTTHDVNVTGTVNTLIAARDVGIEHVVLASSSSVYGANKVLPKREDQTARPMSPYAVSKLAAEQYSLAFANVYQMKALACRFFNVYGPYQRAGHVYSAVIPNFFEAAMHNRPIPLHGGGQQTRDFTFVGSLVNVLTAAVEKKIAHDTPVNAAFGTRESMKDLASRVIDLTQSSSSIEVLPTRPGDVADSQADPTVLKALVPEASATSLDEGLQKTFDWFKSLQQ